MRLYDPEVVRRLLQPWLPPLSLEEDLLLRVHDEPRAWQDGGLKTRTAPVAIPIFVSPLVSSTSVLFEVAGVTTTIIPGAMTPGQRSPPASQWWHDGWQLSLDPMQLQ